MSFPSAMFLSITAGFVCLSFEILWVRIFTVAAQSHPAVFGIVVGAYLLGIGLGAAMARRFSSEKSGQAAGRIARLIVLSAIACYMVIPVTAIASSICTYGYRCGIILVLAAGFSLGGVFPLIVRSTVRGGADTGKDVAFIYTGNIIGSTLGSLVTGYIFLDALSTVETSTMLACICLVLAQVASFSNVRPRPVAVRLLPVFLIPVFLVASGPLHTRLYENLMRTRSIGQATSFARVVENSSGVIAVTGDRVVYGNGALDGVISVSLSPKINPDIDTAYLSFLLHPRARDILEIGLRTGALAQVLVNGPYVRTLTSVEINPGYIGLIKKYPEVSSLLQNPRFTPVIDDGRRWLRQSPGRKFDIIVINTGMHWQSHATDLLSVEFIAMVRDHLNPGGIACVNTTGSRSAESTVARIFSNTARSGSFTFASDSPMTPHTEEFRHILKNFAIDGKPALDLQRARDREVMERLAGTRFTGSSDELITETAGAGIITDDNMLTEFALLRGLFSSAKK